ncbi:proline racemase family protein [Paenibacillus humicola]|uniref:proline racemase family protein n=1 Tax=Paenibacillus humicola TaxID=3110540 RepID=UPI00237BFAD8|nr:proline racemase family protein [Paenibacillus humicola]
METDLLINTIDAHVWGQSLRILTSGLPPLQGRSLREKAVRFQENHNSIRRLLMLEPRGHADMTGCLITESDDDGADLGLLFMHNEGLLPFSGHGIIAAVTIAAEAGLLKVPGRAGTVTVDTLCGRVTARICREGSSVTSVIFRNVPSFAVKLDQTANVLGRDLSFDIAYGGGFFAVADAESLDLRIDIGHRAELARWGKAIKERIGPLECPAHPFMSEIAGIEGVVLFGPPGAARAHSRSTVVFADGQLDRSAGAAGTCARMAAMFARGQLAVGESFVQEGIAGSPLVGTIAGTVPVGPYLAIVPEVTGRAFITGTHQFIVDPSDPLRNGFLLN